MKFQVIALNNCTILNLSSVSNDEEKNAMRGVPTKPPNVLIYSGSEDAKSKVFNHVKETLLQVLHLHSYSIYHLHEKQVHSQPWMENTALLVIGDHDLQSERTQFQFLKYLRSGGKILSLCSSFTVQSVVKHPWEEKLTQFVTSVEITDPGCSQKPDKSVCILCDPFYFKGEHYTLD